MNVLLRKGFERAGESLDRLPKPVVVAGAAVLVVAVAVLDWITPLQMTLAVFHVVPVFLVTWLVGRRAGLGFAIAAAVSWSLADSLHPDAPAGPRYATWDIATKVLFFVVIAELVAALRSAMDRLHEEARTDALTGLLNRRGFNERAKVEVARVRRTDAPLVLAYVDLDGFKDVNDRLGHETGDRVLVAVARALAGAVRDGDVVARLGGDEFAVLFLDSGLDAAQAICTKLEAAVARELGALGVAVGFSVGFAEWAETLGDVDGLVVAADAGMYRVKAGRKARGAGGEATRPGAVPA